MLQRVPRAVERDTDLIFYIRDDTVFSSGEKSIFRRYWFRSGIIAIPISDLVRLE